MEKIAADMKRSSCRNHLLKHLSRLLTVCLLVTSAMAQTEETRVKPDTVGAQSLVTEYCIGIQIEENVTCYKDAISSFLQSWVTAWGKGNADAYLDHYVPGSSPRPELSATEWEQGRRKRISGKSGIVINLELDSMMVNEAGVTEVFFNQSYRSPNYSDEVGKRLSLIRNGNTFRIQLEQSYDRPSVPAQYKNTPSITATDGA